MSITKHLSEKKCISHGFKGKAWDMSRSSQHLPRSSNGRTWVAEEDINSLAFLISAPGARLQENKSTSPENQPWQLGSWTREQFAYPPGKNLCCMPGGGWVSHSQDLAMVELMWLNKNTLCSPSDKYHLCMTGGELVNISWEPAIMELMQLNQKEIHLPS